MNTIDPIKLAYIAGFFDGEGAISITKYQRKGGTTPSYTLMVVVTQMQPRVIHMIHDAMGAGFVYVRPRDNATDLRIIAREACEFLEMLVPYLMVKKEQAELAIEFQSRQGHQHSQGRGHSLLPEFVAEKEMYYRRLQQLKGTSGADGGRGRPRKVQNVE